MFADMTRIRPSGGRFSSRSLFGLNSLGTKLIRELLTTNAGRVAEKASRHTAVMVAQALTTAFLGRAGSRPDFDAADNLEGNKLSRTIQILRRVRSEPLPVENLVSEIHQTGNDNHTTSKDPIYLRKLRVRWNTSTGGVQTRVGHFLTLGGRIWNRGNITILLLFCRKANRL